MDDSNEDKISLLCRSSHYRKLPESTAKRIAKEIIETEDVEICNSDYNYIWCGKNIFTLKKSLSYFRRLARVVEIENSRRCVLIEKTGYGIGKRIFVTSISASQDEDHFLDVYCVWHDYDETPESKRSNKKTLK